MAEVEAAVTSRRALRGAGANATGDDEFDSCDASLCSGATTPAVLASRYLHPTLTAAAEGNGMAVAEFQLQGIDDDDLASFSTACGVDHVSVDTVEGAGGSLKAG